MSKNPRRQDGDHLLSTSTILILSGFLIGLTVGRTVGEDLSPYVLASGLAGFMAYLGLDAAASRREEEGQSRDKEQMESRLDKHVMSISSLGFQLPEKVEEKPMSQPIQVDTAEAKALEFELSQL